jgi:hypothetical protein
LDAIAAAGVNVQRAPPVRRVAEHDSREFEFPGVFLRPGERLPKLVVLIPDLGALEELKAQKLVFPVELIDLLKESASGDKRVASLLAQGLH